MPPPQSTREREQQTAPYQKAPEPEPQHGKHRAGTFTHTRI